jgi:hypothetical protein
VVREGVGGEMNQALYAHMNNKRKMKKKKKDLSHQDYKNIHPSFLTTFYSFYIYSDDVKVMGGPILD